jgi:hypothetical protein
MSPAGPVAVLRAAIATVLRPGTTEDRRSTAIAWRHWCSRRGDAASGVPLSHTSTVSSPVTTSCASLTAPAGTVKSVRK